MRILLDTNVFVLALTDHRRIKDDVRRRLADPDQDVLFSTVRIWEIAVKFALGRRDFRLAPEAALESALDAGFTESAVDSGVAARVAYLPFHHRDPFDRLLVAHAMSLPARLYTTDRTLARYSELVTVVA